jgi:hypothetical protein
VGGEEEKGLVKPELVRTRQRLTWSKTRCRLLQLQEAQILCSRLLGREEGRRKSQLRRDDGASSSRSSKEDSSSGSSCEAEAEPRNLRIHNLRDLYETTGEVHLVCLLANAETISFEEAVRDPK